MLLFWRTFANGDGGTDLITPCKNSPHPKGLFTELNDPTSSDAVGVERGIRQVILARVKFLLANFFVKFWNRQKPACSTLVLSVLVAVPFLPGTVQHRYARIESISEHPRRVQDGIPSAAEHGDAGPGQPLKKYIRVTGVGKHSLPEWACLRGANSAHELGRHCTKQKNASCNISLRKRSRILTEKVERDGGRDAHERLVPGVRPLDRRAPRGRGAGALLLLRRLLLSVDSVDSHTPDTVR